MDQQNLNYPDSQGLGLGQPTQGTGSFDSSLFAQAVDATEDNGFAEFMKELVATGGFGQPLASDAAKPNAASDAANVAGETANVATDTANVAGETANAADTNDIHSNDTHNVNNNNNNSHGNAKAGIRNSDIQTQESQISNANPGHKNIYNPNNSNLNRKLNSSNLNNSNLSNSNLNNINHLKSTLTNNLLNNINNLNDINLKKSSENDDIADLERVLSEDCFSPDRVLSILTGESSRKEFDFLLTLIQ
jgi:hypothetical protein